MDEEYITDYDPEVVPDDHTPLSESKLDELNNLVTEEGPVVVTFYAYDYERYISTSAIDVDLNLGAVELSGEYAGYTIGRYVDYRWITIDR